MRTFLSLALLVTVSWGFNSCKQDSDCEDFYDCTVDRCDQDSGSCVHLDPADGVCRYTTRIPGELLAAGDLTIADRLRITQVASKVIGQVHVNLPLQKAVYGIDPLQELSALKEEVMQETQGTISNAWSFHQKMIGIYETLNDLHANYILPPPFFFYTALLPFTFRDYYVGNERRYVVTSVLDGFDFRTIGFDVGTDIVLWGGDSIENAVQQSGDDGFGSNEAAQRFLGIERLTRRDFGRRRPPQEPAVVVGYIDKDGNEREHTFEWHYFDRRVNPEPSEEPSPSDDPEPFAASSSDSLAELCPSLEEDETFGATVPMTRFESLGGIVKPPMQDRQGLAASASQIDVSEKYAEFLQAGILSTSSGDFGYLSLQSFDPPDGPFGVLLEIARLLSILPDNGLVLDVRGNGGGYLASAEMMLQFFTEEQIDPMRGQVLANNLLLSMSQNDTAEILEKYGKQLSVGVQAGEVFTGAVEIIPREYTNCYSGPKYTAPVILLNDASIYSATDIFSASVQDHGIATIVGAAENTGAGGATVRGYSTLVDYFPTLFEPLPDGVELRTSFARILRVRENSGIPLEFFGVEPDMLYRPTKADRVQGDPDLREYLGEKLAAMSNPPKS